MARKKAAKKAEAPKVEKKAEKQRFESWFASKLSSGELKAHQVREVKAFFKAMKLDTKQEEKGKYEEIFKKF